jgi:DNA-binding HxlR family transcriptional regulator
MLLFGKSRFSDFATPEGISTNILSERLSRLEQARVVTKKQDTVLKNQNIYHLTEKGKQLTPALVDLMLWGIQYDERTLVSKSFVARLATDYEQISQDIKLSIEAGEFEAYRAKEMGVDAGLYQNR